MSTIINARSPYYVKLEPTTGTMTSATIELYIYSGNLTPAPTTATYTITKDVITGNNYVFFEPSELIRDFLQTEYYSDAIDGVWVKIDFELFDGTTSLETGSQTYLTFDGFGYFNEGAQPRTSTDPTQSSYTPMVLQSNTTVYFVRGRDIRIPIFSEPEPSIVTTIGAGVWNEVNIFWENYEPTWDETGTTQNVTDSDDSLDKIQYLIIQSDFVVTGDTITITSTSGNPQTTVITLREYCEPKFEPYRIIFYNKFGALQGIWASKKSTLNNAITDERYQSNVMDFTSDPTYNVHRHTIKRFNVRGNQSIILNTDFLVGDLNDPIEQMLLSDQIWIENESETIPVILKTKSLTRKTSVNDKLIQYTFEFDYSFDTIQNIR